MNWQLLNPLRWFRRTSPRCTKDEALAIARHFGLEEEVKMALSRGYSPDEALLDWDIYPYTDEQFEKWMRK